MSTELDSRQKAAWSSLVRDVLADHPGGFGCAICRKSLDTRHVLAGWMSHPACRLAQDAS